MKEDLKRARRIARDAGLPPELWREFSRFLHRGKKLGHYGSPPKGDAKDEEIAEAVRDFLEEMGAGGGDK